MLFRIYRIDGDGGGGGDEVVTTAASRQHPHTHLGIWECITILCVYCVETICITVWHKNALF